MQNINVLMIALLLPAVAAGGPVLPGFCDGTIPPPPDAQEPNDEMATASPISPANTLAVSQSLHTGSDQDWFFFHGYAFDVTGDVYTVRVLRAAEDNGPAGTFMTLAEPLRGPGLFFRFFSSDGTEFNLLDPFEQGCIDPGPGTFFEYDLALPAEDDYFLQVSQCRNEGLDVNGDTQADNTQYCIPDNAGYQLQIFQPVGAQQGLLSGSVTDAATGAPIFSAVEGVGNVAFSTFSNPGTGQFQSALTVINDGTATISARGYLPVTVQFDIAESQTTPCNVVLTPEASGSPDLQVNGPLANPVMINAGDSMMLSANARNSGDGVAGGSTLRFYLSPDSVISSADNEVAVAPISALPAGGQVAQQVSITGPDSAGVFFAGACVDAVGGESDVGNNCFGAAPVVVADDRVFFNGFESPVIKSAPTSRHDAALKGAGPPACVVL